MLILRGLRRSVRRTIRRTRRASGAIPVEVVRGDAPGPPPRSAAELRMVRKTEPVGF